MEENSVSEKSDVPKWVFDKFRDSWLHQCRQCSYPLELDEASNCYRHLIRRPGQLDCDAKQRASPTTVREIDNTKTLRKRDKKKQATLACLNRLLANQGKKPYEKDNG